MTNNTATSAASGTIAASAQHNTESKRKVVNRLRRARGERAAVISAVEQDSHCRDIVQRLSIVSTALDRSAYLAISSALKECLNDRPPRVVVIETNS